MNGNDPQRSRFAREMILRLLSAADGAGIGLGMTWSQIRSGFTRRRTEFSDAGIRRELNDLVDDNLIERRWDDDMGCDMFRIVSRGREFLRANCPWERIDEFTGRQG